MTNNTSKRYLFQDQEACNMCGRPTVQNKVIGMRLNTSQGFRPKSKTGIAVSVIRCRSCKLIYANPMPVPHDIQDHYGLPPETYWQTADFSWNENYYYNELTALKKLMNIEPGMKSLDIGAGMGRAMRSLQQAGFDAYGFEPSEPFYKKAIEKMEIRPDRLTYGQLENLEYESNFFDFISFGAVLEHLYDPADSIQKAMRWLKPGGIMHIEVPSSLHLPTRIINFYYKLIGSGFVSNISPMHPPYHLYEFTPQSFQKLAERLGFEIASCVAEPCEVLNFPKFTHGILKFIMKQTGTGLQLVIWLRKK